MDVWKQAWWLTRNELSKDKLQWLWSAMFMIYSGSMSGIMLLGQEKSSFINPIVDSFFMIIIPLQGYMFCRRNFRFFQEDSYTQMLAYYRRLPISNETVMWSRIQQSLIAFTYNGFFYYASIYLVRLQNEGFQWDQYLAFALTCTGFGLLITGFYILGEFLNSGKKYMVISILFIPIMVGAALLIRMTDSYGLMIVVEASKSDGLLSPIMWVSILCGMLSVWLCSRLTLKKLVHRDLN